MKCNKCASRPAVMFSIHNGQVVYVCRRHWPEIEHDLCLEWVRLGKVKRVGE